MDFFESLLEFKEPYNNNPKDYEKEYKERTKYLRSKENLEICKPFVTECQRLAEIAVKYTDQYQVLKNRLDKDVMSEKYSVGGEALYRGYYCPSPVIDIVVGGCSRGRLLSRITARSKPTFKYGFNVNNDLIAVDNLGYSYGTNAIVTEAIIRNGELERGIVYKKWNEERQVDRLSESAYCDGQIISFIDCSYMYFNNSVDLYNREDYVYSDKGLSTVHMYRFQASFGPILTHQEYRFMHDDEGYLSQYVIICHPEGSGRLKPYWDGQVYDVGIRRKG